MNDPSEKLFCNLSKLYVGQMEEHKKMYAKVIKIHGKSMLITKPEMDTVKPTKSTETQTKEQDSKTMVAMMGLCVRFAVHFALR